MSSVSSLHRRKSSRDTEGQSLVVTITEPTTATYQNQIQNEDDLQNSPAQAQSPSQQHSTHSPRKLTTSAPDPPPLNGVPFPLSPSRQRVLSTPSQPPPQSPLSSPTYHRTSFGSAAAPNHYSHRSHTRAPSTSSFYAPGPGPSPLSASFPLPPLPDNNATLNENGNGNASANAAPQPPMAHRPAPLPPKRHSRIHSRNLSVYFPRPGTGPPSIAEDGIQEDNHMIPAPETLLKSNGGNSPFQEGRELSSSFTFGGKKPIENSRDNADDSSQVEATRTRVPRRGHHHKHSLSHNFFSFMEPELHDASFTSGAPTPVPTTSTVLATPTSSIPWTRTPSPQPQPATESTPAIIPLQRHEPPASLISSASASALVQFLLGAFLWIRGQEVGSLSCTGLGYWIVFDSFGIALAKVLPQWLTSGPSYGTARVETLAMFAQSIYLIFASVYVCKEAVEHALLTHDQGGHGHHHHRGDEHEGDYGIEFPVFLIFAVLSTLLASSVKFDNNMNIVGATSNRLPSLKSLFEPDQHVSEPNTPLGKASSNPYTVLPFTMGLCILGIWCLGNVSYHRQADLLLAFVMAVITFWASYPAVVALGKILLQTAPERSRVGGKGVMRGDGRMEAFLRVMREFERHPQILHLPPPHIWQLTPSVTFTDSSSSRSLPTLVVTLELHISQDLDDESVLKLTKWAWERCMGVLGGGAEVTVGIVRG